MQITSKQQMYEMFLRGRFGNRLRNWNSIERFYAEAPTSIVVGLRYAGTRAGKIFIPFIPYHSVSATLLTASGLHGLDEAVWIISEMAPDERSTLKGELMRTEAGWYLRYTQARLPMRQAFAVDERHAHGLLAISLVQSAMDASSFADLMDLYEEIPDAIVEFATYEMDLGICPRRNTLIWEVRTHY